MAYAAQIETKTAPASNVEAERALLGSVLVDPRCFLEVLDSIPPDALARFYWRKEKLQRRVDVDQIEEPLFCQPAHQEIWEVMCEMHELNRPIDLVSLGNELADRGRYEIVGGSSRLVSLEEELVTTLFVSEYVRIVVEKWQKRRLQRLSSIANRYATDGGKAASDAMATISEQMMRMQDATLQRRDISSGDAALDVLIEIQQRRSMPQGISGLRTGFNRLDALLSGMKPGNLVMLAARTSVGKSALALQIADCIGNMQRIPVYYASLEMSREELTQRLLSKRTGIDLWNIQHAQVNDIQAARLEEAAIELKRGSLWIDDEPNVTLTSLRTRVHRRRMMEKELRLIVVDYLQLVRHKVSGSDGRRVAITEISHGLKALARETNTTVLAISALSRPEKGKEKDFPTIFDLKESGDLESDADVVILLHRVLTEQLATLRIGKQRNGALGDVDLIFNGPTVSYREIQSGGNEGGF